MTTLNTKIFYYLRIIFIIIVFAASIYGFYEGDNKTWSGILFFLGISQLANFIYFAKKNPIEISDLSLTIQNEIKLLKKKNQEIQCIKMIREKTGQDLKSAKDIYQSL